MRISCFFALVFLSEDHKELIRYGDNFNSDNKGRKGKEMCLFECRLCSKSCSVFYLVEKKEGQHLLKSNIVVPTYLIFDGLGPLNTTMFLEANGKGIRELQR